MKRSYQCANLCAQYSALKSMGPFAATYGINNSIHGPIHVAHFKNIYSIYITVDLLMVYEHIVCILEALTHHVAGND